METGGERTHGEEWRLELRRKELKNNLWRTNGTIKDKYLKVTLIGKNNTSFIGSQQLLLTGFWKAQFQHQ